MQILDLRREKTISDAEGTGLSECWTECHGGWSAGWCATIEANGDRTFLTASDSHLSRAGNGRKTYALNPGEYEADSVYRSMRSQRVLFCVDAEGKIAFLPDDFITARQAETAKRLAQKAHKWEKIAGLPDLIGTDKQIAYASQIRQSFFAQITGATDAVPEKMGVPDMVSFIDYFRGQTQASVWIDAAKCEAADPNEIRLGWLVAFMGIGSQKSYKSIAPVSVDVRKFALYYSNRLQFEAETEQKQRIASLDDADLFTIRSILKTRKLISVWRSTSGEKRVYVGGYDDNVATFYPAKNNFHKENAIETKRSFSDEDRPALVAAFLGLCSRWAEKKFGEVDAVPVRQPSEPNPFVPAAL